MRKSPPSPVVSVMEEPLLKGETHDFRIILEAATPLNCRLLMSQKESDESRAMAWVRSSKRLRGGRFWLAVPEDRGAVGCGEGRNRNK